MKIFVTGASGYIGSALTPALVKAGHQVTALVRSDEAAKKVEARGAKAHRGSLGETASWKQVAAGHEAIIHAAADDTAMPALDAAATDAILEAAKQGTVKHVTYTSGCWVAGARPAKTSDDFATDKPFAMVAWRPAHENKVLAASSGSLRTAVLRPGIVYGGKQGILENLWRSAEQEGATRYVGDGTNHWSMIHLDDLASLYVAILAKQATGAFLGVDDAPVTVGEVAKAISQAAGKGGATASFPLDEARKVMHLFADALALDQVLVAPKSRALGWAPVHTSFGEAAGAAWREWKA